MYNQKHANQMIRVYAPGSPQYRTLAAFCDYLNARIDMHYRFSLKNVCYDAHTGRMFTAVMIHDGKKHPRTALTSSQYKKVLQGESYFLEVAKDMFQGPTAAALYDLPLVDKEYEERCREAEVEEEISID